MAQVFISYAKEDRDFAIKIYSDLKDHGYLPWIDLYDILPGQPWEKTIHAAIKSCNFFLALLSTNSISKKGFVQKEIRYALDFLDEFPPSEIFVIPIRLNECCPEHDKLKNLQWLDFYRSYEESFKRLISTLSRGETDQDKFQISSTKQTSKTTDICGEKLERETNEQTTSFFDNHIENQNEINAFLEWCLGKQPRTDSTEIFVMDIEEALGNYKRHLGQHHYFDYELQIRFPNKWSIERQLRPAESDGSSWYVNVESTSLGQHLFKQLYNLTLELKKLD